MLTEVLVLAAWIIAFVGGVYPYQWAFRGWLRKKPLGVCLSCGHPKFAVTPTTVCPECGNHPTRPPRRTPANKATTVAGVVVGIGIAASFIMVSAFGPGNAEFLLFVVSAATALVPGITISAASRWAPRPTVYALALSMTVGQVGLTLLFQHGVTSDPLGLLAACGGFWIVPVLNGFTIWPVYAVHHAARTGWIA